MPTACCAYGCSNSNMKDKCKENKISFHLFPKDENLRKEWIIRIKRENFNPTPNTRICSEHFEEECFIYQPFTNRRSLKADAVPTKFIFNLTKGTTRKRTSYVFGEPSRESSREKRANIPVCIKKTVASQTDESFLLILNEFYEMRNKLDTAQNNVLLNEFSSTNERIKVNMKCLTGFSHETFMTIFNFLNLSEDLLKKDRMPPIDQFFMFLVKTRTGTTNEFLGIIFKIASSTVSKIFNCVTRIVYTKLKCVNIWPKKDQVKEFMPLQFLQQYPNCRVIIDCTEIEIQRPCNPTEQQLTFSYYKNANTLKALVGISPSGAVTFISDLWCGSISDKALFLKSQLLDLLEEGDLVLADKGFTINSELSKKGCQLKIPHFLKGNIQFTLEQRSENKAISNKRVHIERAIGRIKIFRYFEGAIPYNSLHNLNEFYYAWFGKPFWTIPVNDLVT
ncbi:THAP domain-containing protein 2, partial [Stegodyphus mimosarum]